MLVSNPILKNLDIAGNGYTVKEFLNLGDFLSNLNVNKHYKPKLFEESQFKEISDLVKEFLCKCEYQANDLAKGKAKYSEETMKYLEYSSMNVGTLFQTGDAIVVYDSNDSIVATAFLSKYDSLKFNKSPNFFSFHIELKSLYVDQNY